MTGRPVAVTVENGRLAAAGRPAYPDVLVTGKDLTREAAAVKPMWAPGSSGDPPSARSVFETSIAGELSAELH